MEATGIILAAGKGTRMKSHLPKPLVPLKGKPIINYIIDAFNKAGVKEIVLVVGYKSREIKKALGDHYIYVEQKEQKGTAHAVMLAKNYIEWKGKNIFIFVGDSPLITEDTILLLYEHHIKTKADCSFLTADFKIKLPYARVIKDETGKLIRCVEEKNANKEELKITELLSSHFIFKGDSLFTHINEVKPDRDNGEYYLTDIINIFLEKGLKVEPLKINDYKELVGLNTPEDLAWAEKNIMQIK